MRRMSSLDSLLDRANPLDGQSVDRSSSAVRDAAIRTVREIEGSFSHRKVSARLKPEQRAV